MTLRTLPELTMPKLPADVTFEIPQRAMADWDRSMTALAPDAATTITIFDPIGAYYENGFTVARLAAALRTIGAKPVTVQINSPGGVVDDGLSIYNLLRAHPEKVTVQVIGMAASAASVIAMAGDEIQIGRAARMMIHNTQWFAVGDRHVMAEVYNTMVVTDRLAAELYAARTGLRVEDCGAIMDAETYLSGEQAVEKGFADGFLPADAIKHTAQVEDKPLAYRVEQSLEKDGWSRSERRRALKTLTSGGTPGAASNAMPGAGETDVEDLDVTPLSLALARLKLARA